MHTILSESQASHAADAGIAQAELNANQEFKDIAIQCIRSVAAQKRVFSTDDVAAVMQSVTVETHDKRVMGAMMRRAAKLGYCRAYICPHCHSQVTRKTTQKNSHASPKNYWESLIHNPIR